MQVEVLRAAITVISNLIIKKTNMYKYEFVRIEIKSGILKSKPEQDYKEIIIEYAKNGWRFKQIFAHVIGMHGTPEYYELIFEKEIDNQTV